MEELVRLPQSHRTAFAASCAERLAPAYDLFDSINGVGGLLAFQDSLEYAWRLCLIGDPEHRYGSVLAGLEDLLASIEEVPEDRLGSFAADAVACLIYSLRCYPSSSVEHALFAAQRAYESADALVSERDKIDFSEVDNEDQVLADPVVQRELEKQKADLTMLAGQGGLNSDLLRSIRETSRSVGAQFAAELRYIIN